MVRPTKLAVLALALACHRTSPPPSLVIPHTTGPMKIDGEWDEPDWSKTALRGQFLGSDGALSRPTSEVRLLHDDHDVFVGLYAADDDIRSTDAFDVSIGALKLHVTATGKLDPAIPGVRVAVDSDGSLDDDRNFDEEWLIELAIPREALASRPLAISASRCDTPKHRTQLCAAWHGTAELSVH
jgi:hypothetical protein